MHVTRLLAAGGVMLLLTACNNQPPTLAPGSAPVGTSASGAPAVTPEAVGPAGVNRGYYQGADPNFPRGSSGTGGRSN